MPRTHSRPLHLAGGRPLARPLRLALVAAVACVLVLGACTDDESPSPSASASSTTAPKDATSTEIPPSSSASTTTTTSAPEDGGTTESRPATSTTNPGSPDFCTEWANIKQYAGFLPHDTLEEFRTTALALAAAAGKLVDAAPEAVRPDVLILKEQAEAIAASTAAAPSIEAAQAAAADINATPGYSAAGQRAQAWYEANCERPDLDG